MANALTREFSSQGASIGIFASLKESVVKYFKYRRVLNELSQLSARELADVGLSSHSVEQLAYESIYGKKA